MPLFHKHSFFHVADALIKSAEMYQEYMKHIPIPTHRGSVIPFTTWMGLGKSIKQLYNQPLHYLTNILLKQWDQLRIGSEDECKPLDTLVHPCKAEATIWLIEEVHRHTSSHLHLAKLWLSDPLHHTFIDSIFPKLWTIYRKARPFSFHWPLRWFCKMSSTSVRFDQDLYLINSVWKRAFLLFMHSIFPLCHNCLLLT